jgi:DNA-binding ferritin-like protein
LALIVDPIWWVLERLILISKLQDIFEMFSFFTKIRTEVAGAVNALHERLLTLETRVDALFHHVTSTTVTTVAEAPVKAVEAVATEAVAKVEAVATEVESKV